MSKKQGAPFDPRTIAESPWWRAVLATVNERILAPSNLACDLDSIVVHSGWTKNVAGFGKAAFSIHRPEWKTAKGASAGATTDGKVHVVFDQRLGAQVFDLTKMRPLPTTDETEATLQALTVALHVALVLNIGFVTNTRGGNATYTSGYWRENSKHVGFTGKPGEFGITTALRSSLLNLIKSGEVLPLPIGAVIPAMLDKGKQNGRGVIYCTGAVANVVPGEKDVDLHISARLTSKLYGERLEAFFIANGGCPVCHEAMKFEWLDPKAEAEKAQQAEAAAAQEALQATGTDDERPAVNP